MNIFKKINIHIDFKKDTFDWVWFLYVGTKHYKTFVIYLFILQIDIYIIYKDWMIETKEMINNKIYTVYRKNPKYTNERSKSFLFPRIRTKY